MVVCNVEINNSEDAEAMMSNDLYLFTPLTNVKLKIDTYILYIFYI
jgi:hypothetical protein